MKLFGKPTRIENVTGISVRLPESLMTKPLEAILEIVGMPGDASVRCAAVRAIAQIYKMPNVAISNCSVDVK